jgi:hypothetical protein
VRIRPGSTIALALVFLATCSYYVFTLRHQVASPTRHGAFHIDSTDVQEWADPQVLLAAADHFYFLNNGPAAAPLYSRAEKLFSERGDARNALHAKVGRLRSEAETMSFVEIMRVRPARPRSSREFRWQEYHNHRPRP